MLRALAGAGVGLVLLARAGGGEAVAHDTRPRCRTIADSARRRACLAKAKQHALRHGAGAGTCAQQGQTLLCAAQDIALARCNNETDCYCIRTTAGNNVCGAFNCTGDPACSDCAVCEWDADCVALGYPEGSACAPVTTGRCAGFCESGTFCVVPCGATTGTPPPS